MIVDIVIIAIIALSIFIGWRRGLIMSLFSLASLILAFFISAVFTPVVTDAIEQTRLQEFVVPKLSASVAVELNRQFDDNALVAIEDAAEKLPLPDFMIDIALENVQSESHATIDAVSEALAKAAAKIIYGIIAFIIIFALTVIILQILKSILKLATKLPVVKQADKIGGLLIGIVLGVLIILFLLLSVSAMSYLDGTQNLITMVKESVIANFVYENNIMGKIISYLI